MALTSKAHLSLHASVICHCSWILRIWRSESSFVVRYAVCR